MCRCLVFGAVHLKKLIFFRLISVAPPPKATIPRRNGNATTNQDLFGSTPFDQPLHSSPFDVSIDYYTFDHVKYTYQDCCASVHSFGIHINYIIIINIINICMDSLHTYLYSFEHLTHCCLRSA